MKNKIALVTGASSGIGEATAALLARSGYTVYGTSRKGAQSEQLPYKMIALDVNSEESVEAALKAVIQAEGRIDLVVNNAGFGVEAGGAEESSMAQMHKIFNTNFFGVVRVIRAVLPYMRQQGQGALLI
ncbi:SDR family NAD(P)-dependent oxidoreductase [Methylophilus aquaticus]|uniref:SDR family NAD(P)-dependent oxidoreductase n=1 Tax=Methylophilus aquaticus TaxID=1971610 RepID=A0ABT9JRF6_9PROT|nr:SDR family NAD(P)-dependent oxidoreductase [Methylophilus aquaticus]MDP8567163.1 SDR family NAD(P)-dependent oxidoreductase [Methylophilus aquaticus]